uniref:WRKY19-like zinc finger domain-containing protein n=1 Tax=Peronospora matthiolae TaxID=2874970 RepID=A0AAV1TTT5_9STRA
MPTPSNRRNANRARCQFIGCEKFAQTRGLCKAHGGGSRCRDPHCNKLAQSRGLCIAHGGGRRCQADHCSKLAQSKGFCISHGGGRRCTIPNCEKFSQVKGRCKSHSKLVVTASYPSFHGVVTPPSSTSSAAISPTSTKLSIDFLLSRSTSIGDKAPSQLPMQGAPALYPTPHVANPFMCTAGMRSAPRYETNVMATQRSLLSFLQPCHADLSYSAPQHQYVKFLRGPDATIAPMFR